MLPLARPSLHACVHGHYHCEDLHALYQWLEAHGYHYYGAFGADSFGRFVCEELALGDTGPIHFSSAIEVSCRGAVVAADARAQQFLNEIATEHQTWGWRVWCVAGSTEGAWLS